MTALHGSDLDMKIYDMILLKASLLIFSLILLLYSYSTKSFPLLCFGISLILFSISTRKNRLGKTTIASGISFLSIGVAEIFLPYLAPNPASQVVESIEPKYGKNAYFERIPDFGFKPRAGVYSHSKSLRSNDTVIYDVEYTIGADGYRADAVSNDYRAYLFGGSYTFGEGLEDSQTISSYLLNNHQIHAKNMGVHGYGLHHALFTIQNSTFPNDHNHINVLITSPFHAKRSSCKQPYSRGTPRYVQESGTIILKGVCSGDNFILRVLSKSLIWTSIENLIFDYHTISESEIELYIKIIKEIHRLSSERGSKLVIAYIAYKEAAMSNTSWTNESLSDVLALHADEFVDITLADRIENLSGEYFHHELDTHPSAIANERRAEIISSALMRLGQVTHPESRVRK